jgi:hypothetical protein
MGVPEIGTGNWNSQPRSVQPPQITAHVPEALFLVQNASLQYEAKLHATIVKRHNCILHLLMTYSTVALPINLQLHYIKLCFAYSPIISGLANLISHSGGKEICGHNLEVLLCNARDKVLNLHTATLPPIVPSGTSLPFVNLRFPLPQVTLLIQFFTITIHHQSNQSHPRKLVNSFLFSPLLLHPARQIQPTQTLMTMMTNLVFSKIIDGFGDGKHLITASFIKTYDKI